MIINIHNQCTRRPFFPCMVAECFPQGMAADISFNMAFKSGFFYDMVRPVSGNMHKMVIFMAEDIFIFVCKWPVLAQEFQGADTAFI